MQPGEKVANDLDKVMSKRLETKLPVPPFKKVGFSVRDVLEQPGKVLDLALKPLETMAKKALEPVTKKLNLRIPPPKGFDDLARAMSQLSSAAKNLEGTLARCESQLQGEWQRQADRFASQAKQQQFGGSRGR